MIDKKEKQREKRPCEARCAFRSRKREIDEDETARRPDHEQRRTHKGPGHEKAGKEKGGKCAMMTMRFWVGKEAFI